MNRLTTPEYRLRWARPRDLDELLAIDAESFPDPLDERRLRACLRDTHICVVAEGRRVGQGHWPLAGFVLYQPVGLPGVDPVVLIDRLAVAPGLRGSGVGSRLAARVGEAGVNLGIGTVGAVVPEDDLRALLWLGRRGFRAVALRRGRFGDRDGIAMERPAAPGGRVS